MSPLNRHYIVVKQKCPWVQLLDTFIGYMLSSAFHGSKALSSSKAVDEIECDTYLLTWQQLLARLWRKFRSRAVGHDTALADWLGQSPGWGDQESTLSGLISPCMPLCSQLACLCKENPPLPMAAYIPKARSIPRILTEAIQTLQRVTGVFLIKEGKSNFLWEKERYADQETEKTLGNWFWIWLYFKVSSWWIRKKSN